MGFFTRSSKFKVGIILFLVTLIFISNALIPNISNAESVKKTQELEEVYKNYQDYEEAYKNTNHKHYKT